MTNAFKDEQMKHSNWVYKEYKMYISQDKKISPAN